jgi:CHAD domain-containing protein
MPYTLLAEESIERSIRRIACEQAMRAMDEARSGELSASEAVHEVRKRCKRIRSLLRLVRARMQGAYTVENAWYRDAAGRLAYIRDAQVVIDTFDALLAHFEQPLDDDAFAPIRARLRGRCEEIRQDETAVRERLRKFGDAMEQGVERIASWPFADDDDFDVLSGGLTRAYARGRRALRVACDAPSTEAIHEWRKRVKDHAHHMRLLRCVWKAPMKARRDEAEKLADRLGDDHDLSVLRETLLARADLANTDTLRVLLDLIGRRQAELRSAATPLGARLYAEKPKAFARRMERYFDSWRRKIEATRDARV